MEATALVAQVLVAIVCLHLKFHQFRVQFKMKLFRAWLHRRMTIRMECFPKQISLPKI